MNKWLLFVNNYQSKFCLLTRLLLTSVIVGFESFWFIFAETNILTNNTCWFPCFQFFHDLKDVDAVGKCIFSNEIRELWYLLSDNLMFSALILCDSSDFKISDCFLEFGGY